MIIYMQWIIIDDESNDQLLKTTDYEKMSLTSDLEADDAVRIRIEEVLNSLKISLFLLLLVCCTSSCQRQNVWKIQRGSAGFKQLEAPFLLSLRDRSPMQDQQKRVMSRWQKPFGGGTSYHAPPPFLTTLFSKNEQKLPRNCNTPDTFDSFCDVCPPPPFLNFSLSHCPVTTLTSS